MATTTDLKKLKINYLTKTQYETALENDEINDDELYMTPETGNEFMPKSGGTFTGDAIAISTNRTGSVLRNIVVRASDDSAEVSTNSLIFIRK